MANPPLPTHIFVGAARSPSETRGGVFRQASATTAGSISPRGCRWSPTVQAITVHPASPEVIYLARGAARIGAPTRRALERLGFPGDTEVWSILVHPANPRTLLRRTSPVGVYRSDDGGDTWRRLPRPPSPSG